MADYSRFWNEYRITKGAQIVSFAILVGFTVSLSLWPSFAEANPILLVPPALAAPIVFISSFRLINWRCPRCEELFSYPAKDIGAACQHCGLKKFAEQSAD